VVEVVVVLVDLVVMELLEREVQVLMVVLVVEEDVVQLLEVELEQEILHQYHHHKEMMERLEILVELDMVVMEEAREV
jgi:hypothetical protein